MKRPFNLNFMAYIMIQKENKDIFTIKNFICQALLLKDL